MQLFVNIKDVIEYGFIALVILFFIYRAVAQVIRQKLCPHEQHFENGACHAICTHCRKDLGFIGTWRENHPPTKAS